MQWTVKSRIQVLALFIAICFILGVGLLSPNRTSSSTHAQSATDTPAPIPELLQVFNEYMHIDPDCLLPCWHGIDLGEAPTSIILSSLQDEFGADNVAQLYVPIDDFDGGVYAQGFSIEFIGQNASIIGLQVRFAGFTQPHPSGSPNQLLSGYSLYNVISAYGHPSEIYIDQGWPRISVYGVYDDPLLIVSYEFSFLDFYEDIQDNILNACPTTENLFTFTLYALVETRHEELLSTFDEFFEKIDEVTTFDVDSFSEQLLENPSLCFDLNYEE